MPEIYSLLYCLALIYVCSQYWRILDRIPDARSYSRLLQSNRFWTLVFRTIPFSTWVFGTLTFPTFALPSLMFQTSAMLARSVSSESAGKSYSLESTGLKLQEALKALSPATHRYRRPMSIHLLIHLPPDLRIVCVFNLFSLINYFAPHRKFGFSMVRFLISSLFFFLFKSSESRRFRAPLRSTSRSLSVRPLWLVITD